MKGRAWPFGVAFVVLGLIVIAIDVAFFIPMGFPGQNVAVYILGGIILVTAGAYTVFEDREKGNSDDSR